eukprot:jgi/Chrzof1/11541/UNPLg00476.t1
MLRACMLHRPRSVVPSTCPLERSQALGVWYRLGHRLLPSGMNRWAVAQQCLRLCVVCLQGMPKALDTVVAVMEICCLSRSSC